MDPELFIGRTAGARAGCQYCLARTAPPVEPGEPVRLLSGVRAGTTGTVQRRDPESGWLPNYVPVVINEAEAGGVISVNREKDLLERVPGAPPASWALPVKMRYGERIDQLVVTLAEATNWDHLHELDWERFYQLVYYVWNEQLPVQPEELQAVLQAHGIPDRRCGELADLYDHGRKLLIFAKHKPPAKSRRLPHPPR